MNRDGGGGDKSSNSGSTGNIKTGPKSLNESSNSGNSSDESSNDGSSLRNSNHGHGHLNSLIGTSGSLNTQSSIQHHLSSVPSQTAVTASQSSLYHHPSFKFGAPHPHPFADVAPTSLVMHHAGTQAEAMLQLQAAAAVAGVDYSTIGSIGGSAHQ